jgi:hypothetical protein
MHFGRGVGPDQRYVVHGSTMARIGPVQIE